MGHVITALITTFASISYFAMATGDGNSFAHIVVKEAHKHTPDTVEHIFRQVFWARYVDWALTTPLLLLDLAFLAGMNGANITVTIVADLIMVLLGLFAAFGRTDGQKWGYYTIACIATSSSSTSLLSQVVVLSLPSRTAPLSCLLRLVASLSSSGPCTQLSGVLEMVPASGALMPRSSHMPFLMS